MDKKIKIYALIDPRTKTVKYIGSTIQALKKRLCGHLSNYINIGMKKWIKELKQKNLIPEIILLEETIYNGTNDREVYYMNKYKDTILNVNFKVHNNIENQQKHIEYLEENPKECKKLYFSLEEQTKVQSRGKYLYINIPQNISKILNIKNGDIAKISYSKKEIKIKIEKVEEVKEVIEQL